MGFDGKKWSIRQKGGAAPLEQQYRNWVWQDYNLYEAKANDTFDDIARKAYGDERLYSILLYVNPDTCDRLLLSGGEIIRIPIINLTYSEKLPPWRRV